MACVKWGSRTREVIFRSLWCVRNLLRAAGGSYRSLLPLCSDSWGQGMSPGTLKCHHSSVLSAFIPHPPSEQGRCLQQLSRSHFGPGGIREPLPEPSSLPAFAWVVHLQCEGCVCPAAPQGWNEVLLYNKEFYGDFWILKVLLCLTDSSSGAVPAD